MDAWIGVIGTLLGVALGGVVSYLTSRQQIIHEKQLSLSTRQIEKVEKAHEVLTSISVSYRGFFASDTFIIFTGTMNEDKVEGRLPFEELDMLFSFYAPSHALKAKQLIDLCQSYGSSSVDIRSLPRGTSEEKTKLIETLKEKYEEIDAHITELKRQLAQSIHAYAK